MCKINCFLSNRLTRRTSNSSGTRRGTRADVKMTLTAPGCGMGPVLAQDVQNKLLSLEPIDEANVELVGDPPWNQGMMTEAAKLQLGLMRSGEHTSELQ